MNYKMGLALSLIAASVLMGETFELGKIEVSESKDISANQTTQTVDAQTIKDTESKTVAQALENIPGTYIEQTGARNDTGIRIRALNKVVCRFMLMVFLCMCLTIKQPI